MEKERMEIFYIEIFRARAACHWENTCVTELSSTCTWGQPTMMLTPAIWFLFLTQSQFRFSFGFFISVFCLQFYYWTHSLTLIETLRSLVKARAHKRGTMFQEHKCSTDIEQIELLIFLTWIIFLRRWKGWITRPAVPVWFPLNHASIPGPVLPYCHLYQ